MENIKESELLNLPIPSNDIEESVYTVYKKRWLILILFMLYTISNCNQYIEFSIIADVIVEYYQVSYTAVDWSSTINLVVYVVCSIPASYLTDKIGLRKTIILGILGTCVGSWLKVGSVHPDRFWLVIFGQGIVAVFQVFVFPLIPILASTWFGYDQISTAVGLGGVGCQIGMALSFILPSLIVFKGKIEDIERRLYILNILFAVIPTILAPLIFIFFTEAPPTPPSRTHHHALKEKRINSKSFIKTCRALFFNKSFVLFSFIFGINTSIVNPVQIMLNQIVEYHYPDSTYHAGIIGVLQTSFSLLSSITISIILDKFKRQKIICWILYFSFFVVMMLYSGTIDQGLGFLYLTSILIGILSGSVWISGIQLIMEFSYPEAESISVGVLNTWILFTYILITPLYGYIFRTFSITSANVTMLAIILTTDLLFVFLKFDLRKEAIENAKFKNCDL